MSSQMAQKSPVSMGALHKGAGGKGGKQPAKPAVAVRKQIRNSLNGVTKPSIRRLARRSGVLRIGDIYEPVREALKKRLHLIVKDALIMTNHGQRKTVNNADTLYAIKRTGDTLYGFTA